MNRMIDISRPLDSTTAPWPGDTPFSFHWSWKRQSGNSVNVGAMTLSTHFGTHCDAPFHFTDSGQTIDQTELSLYYGRARVIDVRGLDLIGPEVLPAQVPSRVLFRTDAWLDSSRFPETIPLISLATIEQLRDQKVKLVGIDLPSVDEIQSQELPNHHAFNASGIAILESLFLKDIFEGEYLLSALPLRLRGGDAAPVRAVLIELDKKDGDGEDDMVGSLARSI